MGLGITVAVFAALVAAGASDLVIAIVACSGLLSWALVTVVLVRSRKTAEGSDPGRRISGRLSHSSGRRSILVVERD